VKVAFQVDQLWFAAPGGIGTYVAELAQALTALADGPKVVGFRARIDGTPHRPPGVPVVELAATIGRLYPAWALLGRPHLPAPLDACDVVHATNHASIPPVRRGQALVATVHDLAFDRFPTLFPPSWRWLYRAGVRAAIARAHRLLVPSRSTARDLADRGADPTRIAVTPLAPALPTATGDPGPVLERLKIPRPYVVCPATIEPRKNQAILVRAFRQAAAELPHALVLAGPVGWRTGSLEAELARGGPGTIVRTGGLSAEDLDAVYRGADAVAYPSRYEGFGLVIVEAMARGVPVVTSTTPACSEVAGDAALLVDPDDVGGLADALVRACTDAGLRAELVRRGRRRVEGLSWAATAHATLRAYRQALAEVRG
jgi:glycosyltransferase involved in cell wall biosynthesis